jgi:tetratricopeptide (TPR) repeat protein
LNFYMTDWQLGLQAFHEGRMREAADRLQAALEEHELTTSQRVRYETCAYLGAALYTLGLPAEALAAFEKAFRFSPDHPPSEDLMMNIAHVYLALGRRDAAQEALRFLLAHTPGHVAATMLVARLDNMPADDTISGAILGASPQTAEQYIRTLTFSQPLSGGYAPAEVQEALRHLQKLITGLSRELKQAQEENALHEIEILRYRQMEDAVVESMLQTRPPAPEETDEAKSGLSPIEILFRQKS